MMKNCISSSPTSDSVEKFTSPARKRKNAARKWDVDGIDVNHPNTYIARQSLVAKAIKSARQHRFLVVGSPPGTGKTALSQLIQAQLVESNEADTGGKIPGYYIRPSEVTDDFNLFDYVANRTGVDLRHYKVSQKLKGSPEIWLIFDDAQRLYDRRHDAFWELVTKQKGRLMRNLERSKLLWLFSRHTTCQPRRNHLLVSKPKIDSATKIYCFKKRKLRRSTIVAACVLIGMNISRDSSMLRKVPRLLLPLE